jgi:hypothetical protein
MYRDTQKVLQEKGEFHGKSYNLLRYIGHLARLIFMGKMNERKRRMNLGT